MSDRLTFHRALIAALAALVLGQALLLAAGDGSLLVRLARQGDPPPASGPAAALTLVQTVEGLTRLDGAPELLLTKAQAERLVPVMPLVRATLAEGTLAKGAPTVENLGAMLLAYLQNTLSPAQAARLADLSARGELASTASEVLDRLPQLDKALRQRAGLPLDESVPVRRSLDLLRVRDLLLGMLLLEENEDTTLRLTKAQAELLAPMSPLVLEALRLRPGQIGKVTLPVLEAQVRALLTERQQAALVRTTDAKGLESVDVNLDELLQQFGSLLEARRKGGTFRFDLASIVDKNPMEAPREGPAVIPQRAERELPVLARGILLHLEPNPSLRLDAEQVEALALVAPRAQQALQNLMNRVMDDGLPEVEGRVARILTQEQLFYIRDHQHDPVQMLEYVEGEEPVAKELGRFLEARASGVAYQPNFHKEGGAAPPAQTAQTGIRPSPRMANLPPAPPAPVMVPSPAGSPNPKPTPSPKMIPTPGIAPKPTVIPSPKFVPQPGIAPSPTLAPTPTAKPSPRPSPLGIPLEARVRGILFGLEKDRARRLDASQLQRFQALAPRLRAALDGIEAGRRSQDSRRLEVELDQILTDAQRATVGEVAARAPLPLHAASGESPLSREVRRFLEARRAGREYAPMSNPEAP